MHHALRTTHYALLTPCQAHEDLGGGVLEPNRTLRLTLDVTCASPAHKANRLCTSNPNPNPDPNPSPVPNPIPNPRTLTLTLTLTLEP